MKRHTDWPTRLSSFLLTRDCAKFQWGVNDCALFSCDAIFAMTGVDLAADYRNTYSTSLGSVRAIRRVTRGSTVEDAAVHAATQHRLTEIDPCAASRGDWVLIRNLAHNLLGIVALDGKHATAVSETGVVFLPLHCAVRAWRI